MAASNNTTAPHQPSQAGPEDDPVVRELIKSYQSDLEAGRRPDRVALIGRHPELSDVLKPYLDGLDFLHRGGRGLSGTGGTAARLETGLGPGQMLGEFRIVREVGRGGMGVVYEAFQPSLNRTVALKVLPASLASDRNRLTRFTLEAQAAAAVAHPHIVPVYAVGEDRNVSYYVMRLIDGSALDAIARRISQADDGSTAVEHDADARLSPKQLVELAARDRRAFHLGVSRLGIDVARALDHAHQGGVVHRDVKPANLLLGSDGHIWVTDFGLAQFADAGTVTRTGATLGTLRYMSPEQAAGDRRRLDHRTDIYSLAATLYELHAGRPAFDAEDPLRLIRQIAEADPPFLRGIDPTVPLDLETVLLKALQKDPRDRYASAAEFADDLERFVSGQPVHARRPSLWDRVKRRAGRHPNAVAAALVSFLVIGVASGVSTALVLNQQAETNKAYKAVAAEQAETRKAEQAASALAKAERDRADEAERRFRRAKELGDLVLDISEQEMGSDRPLQGPRRRLLLAALENSRWLLAGGHEDPKVREELQKVVARVEALLADQDLRWEADGAFLLKDGQVRAELKLTPDQIRRVDRTFTPPEKGPADKGPRPFDKGPMRPFDPTVEAKIELIKSLSSTQRHRLRQISIQMRIPWVFGEAEVLDPLNIYPLRAQIRQILSEELFKPGAPKGPPGGDKDAKARALERILDLLRPDQRAAWDELIGKPFNPWPK